MTLQIGTFGDFKMPTAVSRKRLGRGVVPRKIRTSAPQPANVYRTTSRNCLPPKKEKCSGEEGSAVGLETKPAEAGIAPFLLLPSTVGVLARNPGREYLKSETGDDDHLPQRQSSLPPEECK